MNITYRKPPRRSMLGTRARLSMIPDNLELRTVEPEKPTSTDRILTRSRANAIESLEEKVSTLAVHHKDTKMVTRSKSNSTEVFEKKVTRSKTTSNDSHDEKILNNIEVLLKKNADSLEALQREREQLLKIERMLKDKLQSDQLETESSKENEPPNQNTPSKLFLVPKPPERVEIKTGIMKEMRTSLKCLKTPKQNRMTRQSIIYTPHSMSFHIQKQLEDLLE